MDAKQLLKQSELFRQFNSLELLKVTEIARREFLAKGETIISEGENFEVDSSLYIVSTGLVKVVLQFGEGRELVLAILSTPDLFGELSFMDLSPRSANVVAMDETELLKLDHDALLELLDNDQAMALKFYNSMARILTSKIRQMNEKVIKDSARFRH